MMSAGSEPDTRRSAPLAVLWSLLERKGSHGAGSAQLPQLGVQAHEGPGHTQQSQEQGQPGPGPHT